MDNEWHKYDMHLYRDSFQNYKVYQIPKAQLIKMLKYENAIMNLPFAGSNK